jgi:hypothetical protein
MIEKNPSIAFSKVGIYPKAFKHDDYVVKELSEDQIGISFMEWNGLESENPQPRQVLVIGVDTFRSDFEV